jgi:hypothetical protein
MKQLLKIAAAPTAAAIALAWVAMATPAAASPGEYCRIDYGSGGIRLCSFATIEQCRAAVSGRSGVCERDPFLPDNSSAFAYQPKHPLAKRVRRPVGNQ